MFDPITGTSPNSNPPQSSEWGQSLIHEARNQSVRLNPLQRTAQDLLCQCVGFAPSIAATQLERIAGRAFTRLVGSDALFL